MTRNILESNSQEAAKITRGIDGAKLSQVTQAVNEVISQTSKLSPEEIVQIQEKSTLRTLVDIAERVHRMGSLRRVLSPADYEKMLAIGAKHVQPFVLAKPFGASDHEKIRDNIYEMPSRFHLTKWN